MTDINSLCQLYYMNFYFRFQGFMKMFFFFSRNYFHKKLFEIEAN